jgi:hypothetical protein
MNIGVSLFLLTIGAILTFAVDVSIRGLDLTTVGIILMIVGGVYLLLSLILLASRGGRPVEGGIVEERRIYNDDPLA